jgi:DNA gyrase subunit A
MARIASEMLEDLDKETVPYVANYDDTLMIPAVLPNRVPNLLINGSSGIAVGMATNIPPHNLREVVDACLALIDNPAITIDGLMEFVKGRIFRRRDHQPRRHRRSVQGRTRSHIRARARRSRNGREDRQRHDHRH